MGDEALLDPGVELPLVHCARMALGNRAEGTHEEFLQLEGLGRIREGHGPGRAE